MDYYSTIPSGPSSRPYNPNHAAHQHQQNPDPTMSYSGPSSISGEGEGDAESPRYSSYGLMTDLPSTSAAASAFGQDQGGPSQAPSVEIDDSAPLVEAHQDLDTFLESFWTRQMGVVERDNPDFRTYPLPLARIKKVMKSDEDVKMISAEVPIMFSKACEVFISELTCRAWLVAETSKRRTLQKADVANAIAHSDMFDFLIDIVPRDDGSGGGNTGAGGGGGGGGGAVDHEQMDEAQDQEEDGAQVYNPSHNDNNENEAIHPAGDGRTQAEQDEDDRVFTEFVRDDDD